MKDMRGKAAFPKPTKPDAFGAAALEWVNDISGRAFRATAIGARRLLIENHTGIEFFQEDLVRLSTLQGALCVHGLNLSLCEVRPNALIIHGCIRRVDFPDDGGER